MTLLEVVAPVNGERALTSGEPTWRLADVLAVGSLLWWASLLTWGSGGREPYRLSIGLVLVGAAFLATRAWCWVGRGELALAAAVGLAPLIVVATAPTGWRGIDDAASYLYCALAYLTVRGWARDRVRRGVVIALILVAAGAEFAQGWLAWWGGEDQTRLFQGTFYWHNQAGIFMALGAVAGLAVVAFGSRPLNLLGWVLSPLAIAGTFFSTSRGSQLALGVGALVVLFAALSSSERLRSGGRVLLTCGLGAATAWVLTGPPFFPTRVSPLAGTAARGSSLEGNGVQRLEDWRRGWEIFKHWPLTGAGFHSFRSATEVATTRHDATRTAFAHNGFLQAISDGGLVLAVPLFLAVGLLLLVAARRFAPAVRQRGLATVAGSTGFLVAVLHSGMDFDWSYPSLLALAGILAALIPAPRQQMRAGLSNQWAGGLAILLLAAVVGVGVVGVWHGGLQLNYAVGSTQ